MKWDIPRDREAFFRIARLIAVCLIFLALVRHGFAPGTRALTLLATASVLSMAALYELSVRDKPETWSALSVLTIATFCLLTYFLLRYFDPAPIEGRGLLIAANEGTPANGCDGQSGGLSANHLLMIFGSDGVVGRGDGPFTPISAGSCPALTFQRRNGGLLVDSFGYDSDNNVIYRIRQNVFEQVLRGFLQERRPDASSLEIVDELGHETLSIRYMNKNTVKVSGTFRCGDTRPVIVGDSLARIGKTPIGGHSCRAIDAGAGYAIAYKDPLG
ncbi:MAG: hypothetical protein V4527_11915 [Pseudomonadota bacterium]